MNKSRRIIANTVVIILILAGLCWIGSIFIHFGGQYTDNAQIHKDIVPVSARIQGFVKDVRFTEFQEVRQGDTLVLVEDAEFRLMEAQARAGYENALAGRSAMSTSVSAMENNILAADSGINEVKIQLENAETEYRRYENLYAKGAVTKQQYDGVKTMYEGLKAKVETMQRQKASTSLARNEQEQRLQQTAAGIDVAEAALDLARLNLSYTVITAPCSGITYMKDIQPGELVMPGRHLLSIVSTSAPWIIANFRESQLKGIHAGDKVEVKVDAFKGKVFEGSVAAISDATGATFSMMAPDNSVGNFVKVEQRIPVKIVFTASNDADDIGRLSSGMNVTCKVLK